MTLNLSFPRTCLKRGYLWKSSWSSSDLSLIFNQHVEENVVAVHPKQRWALRVIHPTFPPSIHPPAVPRRLQRATVCTVKAHTLIKREQEGPRARCYHGEREEGAQEGFYDLALFNCL